MYLGHTRRQLTRLAQVGFGLAFGAAFGCSDPIHYANTGAGGFGGAASASGAAGTGGSGGTLGSAGTGGSMGGAGGDSSGTGGSVGGAVGSAGTGGSIGGSVLGVGGQAGQATLQPWPTSDAVVIVDSMNEFPKNLSDLVYEQRSGGAPDVLWGIQNDPSVLYCLLWNGTTWNGMTDGGWTNGKTIRYPGGTGHPDSEGLARAEWSSPAIYVSAERDNDNNGTSRLSVLRYDTSVTGTTELVATNEWNLTSDLPPTGANLGLEAIAWVPDTVLVANGFIDDAANAVYDPSRYANHGTGLFFVGLESNGTIYGYALDHSAGTFQRVATVASGHPAIMSLQFDRDAGNLWAYCDNGCSNQAAVLRIVRGHFVVQALYDHPATLPSSNFEGITFAPDSECAQGTQGGKGTKSFFWTDDDDAGGHALYRGTIPCGPLP